MRLLDDVILANLEVARGVARRYRRRGVSDLDLEQAAYEGRWSRPFSGSTPPRTRTC